MNLFELFVKIGVDDQASKKLSDISGKLGSGLKTAAKIGTAAVTTAVAGITALTTAAVKNYAEYEQLVGGVQTLFNDTSLTLEEYAESVGKSVDDAFLDWADLTSGARFVMNNAERAFKTAGLSANQYMETVTSFSASLIQSLGGDTDAAAKKADIAITDMADNANKMGSSIETLQTAYAGFAKGQFTLLDNLKLGYGGTKEEMMRLLADAEKISGIKYDISSYADIVDAIHVIQTEMGIAGATALEAGTTIEGSVNSMKAAWANLVTGFADENADIELLIENLVETIVGDGTENNLGVIGNVLPAIETALGGIAKLIEGAAPKIIGILPGLVKRVVPSVISAATGIVNAVVKIVPDLLNTVVDAIIANAPALIDSAIVLIGELSSGILSQLPKIVALGLDLIVSLANGISKNLGTLIPTIIDVVLQIVDTLTSPAQLQNLLNAALLLVTELAYGLVDAIPALVDAALTIIENLVSFLTNPGNIGKLLLAAAEVVIAIGTGIVNAIPRLLEYWKKVPTSIIDNFKNTDWGQLGTDLVNGFRNGISRAWTSLSTWFKNLFGDLIGVAKKILGIASPSKVFKKIGGFTAEGFGIGFEDEFAHVKDDMEKSLKFDDASIGINASLKKMPADQNSVYGNTRGVSIVQNIYSEAKTAADLMHEAVYQQEMAVYMGV